MLRQIRYQKCIKNKVPGGDIVLSSTEGIVISIIGLLDGNPLVASWQAAWISSILKERDRTGIRMHGIVL
jgi:hypothetical protein